MSTSFVQTAHRGLSYRERDRAYRLILTAGGKQHRRVLYNHNEAQAIEALRLWRLELSLECRSLTLNALYEEHKSLYASTLSLQTLRTIDGFYTKWVKPRFGDRKLSSLNFKDYQKFVDFLISRGLKPKTIKNITSFLSTLYNFAIKAKYADHNPIPLVVLPKYDNLRRFTLTRDQSRALFAAIYEFPDPKMRAFWLFLAHGRRLNEVKSIRWADIQPNGYYFIPALINKAKKDMEFSASPFLMDFLTAIKPKCARASDLVFPSPVTGLKLSSVSRSWNKLLTLWSQNLGVRFDDLPKMRIHDLRHLIGDYAINELHLPIEKVSHALGHSSIAITEKYVHKRAESSKEVIGAILTDNLGIRLGDVSPDPSAVGHCAGGLKKVPQIQKRSARVCLQAR
ncbi:MAG: site-specific integrase [Helicobacteraceae bacterium]|nr:site-specific integrase [Helicobacteraceae bacterium]